jgi:uncharacterized membrane protein YkoI
VTISKHLGPFALSAALAAALTGSSATEGAARASAAADACAKSVRVIGAEVSRAEEKGSQGELFYRFVVRTNGIDYDVVCDAATGVVRDVALRGTEETH